MLYTFSSQIKSVIKSSCDFTNSYKLRNGFGGRAAGLVHTCQAKVTGSIPGVSHKFRIVRISILACLIKQPNGTLSRTYVQTYIRIK